MNDDGHDITGTCLNHKFVNLSLLPWADLRGEGGRDPPHAETWLFQLITTLAWLKAHCTIFKMGIANVSQTQKTQTFWKSQRQNATCRPALQRSAGNASQSQWFMGRNGNGDGRGRLAEEKH